MATIRSLLAERVTLQVRSVDRLFFQGWHRDRGDVIAVGNRPD